MLQSCRRCEIISFRRRSNLLLSLFPPITDVEERVEDEEEEVPVEEEVDVVDEVVGGERRVI